MAAAEETIEYRYGISAFHSIGRHPENYRGPIGRMGFGLMLNQEKIGEELEEVLAFRIQAHDAKSDSMTMVTEVMSALKPENENVIRDQVDYLLTKNRLHEGNRIAKLAQALFNKEKESGNKTDLLAVSAVVTQRVLQERGAVKSSTLQDAFEKTKISEELETKSRALMADSDGYEAHVDQYNNIFIYGDGLGAAMEKLRAIDLFGYAHVKMFEQALTGKHDNDSFFGNARIREPFRQETRKQISDLGKLMDSMASDDNNWMRARYQLG